MNTYIVRTRAPRGPRSFTSEAFAVHAESDEAAGKIALEAAHPGATIREIKLVERVARVHLG
jgi:hypothetical protein